MERNELKEYLIDSVVNDDNREMVINSIERVFKQLEQYETALQFYGDPGKYFYAKQDHSNTRLAEDGGEIARKALIRDKYGRVVTEGDTIKFRESENKYKVTFNNGVMGCYEDNEFIPLHLVLRNFEVIENEQNDNKNNRLVRVRMESSYYCKDCKKDMKPGERCPLNREGVMTPCNPKEL